MGKTDLFLLVPFNKKTEPVDVTRHSQSQHAEDALLSGAQHWKVGKSRVCAVSDKIGIEASVMTAIAIASP